MEGFQTCNNCRKVKNISDFGLRKDDKPYCECIECRDKKKRKKQTCNDTPDNSIKQRETHKQLINETDEKKKRENRPTISQQKQVTILKEQNFNCRGPGPNECKYYECDMKCRGKKFSDEKSADPQFDHIIRWKEGGNGIGNIQALCPNCHSQKTTMENLINEDEHALQSERVKGIYECLSKPKYVDNSNDDSETDSSDDDDFIFPRKRILRRRKS